MEILFIETLRDKYQEEYTQELNLLKASLSEMNFEKKKQFQKIYTKYGIWYTTIDLNTDCAYLLLCDNNFQKNSAIRLKENIIKIIERVPRYFDKQTNIRQFVSNEIQQLIYKYDKNEQIMVGDELIASIESIRIDMQDPPPLLLSEDHLEVRLLQLPMDTLQEMQADTMKSQPSLKDINHNQSNQHQQDKLPTFSKPKKQNDEGSQLGSQRNISKEDKHSEDILLDPSQPQDLSNPYRKYAIISIVCFLIVLAIIIFCLIKK